MKLTYWQMNQSGALTMLWDVYYHLRFKYAIQGSRTTFRISFHCWILHKRMQLAHSSCTLKWLFQFQQPEEIRRVAVPLDTIQQSRLAAELQYYSKPKLKNIYKMAMKNTDLVLRTALSVRCSVSEMLTLDKPAGCTWKFLTSSSAFHTPVTTLSNSREHLFI